MQDRDRQSLFDIVNSAQIALEYVSERTKADVLGDRMAQDALVRRLEIIGEAATRLSDEARDELSHISWRSIIGMRNTMIYEYDRVEVETVWDTVTKVLPDFIRQLEPYLD